MNAAMTGAQAAYGRHNIQNSFNDQYISLQADHKIHWEHTERYKDSHIGITTFNNVVLLTGQVPNNQLHYEVEHIVKDVPGVQEVYNQTTVGEASTTLTQLADSWITAKIKSQLIANNDVDPSQIKVITESGTVYLMGFVFPDQAEVATEIAKNTSGVQNVVKVFSYIHISKT